VVERGEWEERLGVVERMKMKHGIRVLSIRLFNLVASWSLRICLAEALPRIHAGNVRRNCSCSQVSHCRVQIVEQLQPGKRHIEAKENP